MNTSALELIGMLVACGAAAAALVAEDRRAPGGDGRGADRGARCWSLGDVWDEPRVVDFRHSPAQLGGAVVVGALALALLAAAFRRRPECVRDRGVRRPAIARPGRDRRRDGEPPRPALPGDRRSGVIASILSGREPKDGRRTTNDSGPWPKRLRWLLAATVVLYAIQSAYSVDVPNAIENIGFFLVPFAVLFVLLARRAGAGSSPAGR